MVADASNPLLSEDDFSAAQTQGQVQSLKSLGQTVASVVKAAVTGQPAAPTPEPTDEDIHK